MPMAKREGLKHLQEELVGILKYANSAPRISGILKQRYTDFKVNEIDLSGNVVHLTDLHHHQFEEKAVVDDGKTATNASKDKQELVGTANGQSTGQIIRTASEELREAEHEEMLAAEVESFKQLAGEANAKQLQDFLAAASVYEREQEWSTFPDPVFLEPDDDKEKRTAVHDFFKKPIFVKLSTETMRTKNEKGQMVAGASSIRLSYQQPKRRRQRRSNRMSSFAYPKDWEGGDKEYLKFVLYKDNLETQAVLGYLSKLLHVSPSAFGIAGTKDRRASTVQHVTIKKVQPFRLAQQNAKLRDAQVGDFQYVSHPLHLGGLSGNFFDLILRNVRGSPADVERAADGLKKSGFINYFGLQRFGHSAAPTHMAGSLLLKGDWEGAVKAIMSIRDGDRASAVEARQHFQAGRIPAAAKSMPNFMQSEKAILQTLVSLGHSNYLAALQSIPQNMRNMYMHSFQSYLWNLAASHRVETHGVGGPVVGDLVLPQDLDSGETGADVPASKARLEQIHLVTEEDIKASKFSIEDVVIPLPGSKVKMPKHSTAEVFKHEAEKFGVSFDDSPHEVKDFSVKSLPGDYRRLLVRPKQLAWKLLLYGDLQQDLAYTDLDAVLGKPRPDVKELLPGNGPTVPEGEYLALQLAFALPISSYATMLVRELLKGTTSNIEHREMTKADEASNIASVGLLEES